MRLVVRLLLAGGMLLSASVVGPVVAAADPTDGPSALVPGTPSDAPSADTPADPAASASASASANSSPGSSAGASQSSGPSARLKAAAVSDAHVTITDKPKNPTVYPNTAAHTLTLRYEVDKGVTDGALNVAFHCTMKGPHYAGHEKPCGSDPTQTDPNKTTGSQDYSLTPSATPYKFTVWATYNDATSPTTPLVSPQATYTWRMYSVYAPGSFMPSDGASFNNPVSSNASGRTNLTRMIRTIKAMPGYREALHHGPCPTLGHYGVPGFIRVSLYSMTDVPFANAMDAASRRCISVQILMNDHLNRRTDPAWRRMENALGSATKAHGVFKRSFAHRCHRACRGGGVLHTKMYLFDSRLPDPAGARNKITNTVFMGSSNMTSNASLVQWNDLYGIVKDPEVFTTYNNYFNLMRRDNGYHRNTYKGFSDDGGKYITTFWPVTKGHDPEMTALRSIHCTGATGGSGISGHTVVYINMHAWFGLRGLAFQRQVRSMYAHGCYIRILYSFMTKRVYHRLTAGTGGRMQARRTIFSNHGSRFASVYSHFKNIAVSGHVGGDSNARVVWTGSNNFTPDGKNFDEVMMRIRDGGAFTQYRNQFNHIKKRKSSGTYASFTEPKGGGRAP